MIKPPRESGDTDDYWRTWIQVEMTRSAELKQRTAESVSTCILRAVRLIANCFGSGGKLLICGNGGSAADAQHMAAEFVNRLSSGLDRPGLPALALTTDTSFLTSYANDVGYDGVFERQVLALGKAKDVLVTITTSGKSTNILRALRAAREKEITTIALVGEAGATINLVDCAIVVPSQNTQHVQETFLSIEHVICGIVEQMLFRNSPRDQLITRAE